MQRGLTLVWVSGKDKAAFGILPIGMTGNIRQSEGKTFSFALLLMRSHPQAASTLCPAVHCIKKKRVSTENLLDV